MKLLDILIALLTALIAAMLLTGGTVLHLPHAKIEFSSLDPWMLVLLLLLWLQQRRGQATGLETISRGTAYFADPSRGNRRSLRLFVGVVLAATAAHFLKHWNFDTHALDVLPIHQPIYWPFGSPPLRCDQCIGGTFLSSHQAFPLLAFGALFQIPLFRAPLFADEWIFAIQSAIAACAVLWSLRILCIDRKPGLVFWAILPLIASRAFRSGLVWDFREDVLGFAFLLSACACLQKRRWAAYSVFVFLAAISKENFAFVTAFLAVPAWFVARSRLASVLTLLFSLTYAAFVFRWVIPHFNPVNQTDIVSRLGDFGQSPAEIVSNLLSSPKAWWMVLRTRLFTFDRIKYLVLLFAPFAPLLSRRSLPWLAPLIPAIAMNLVSNTSNQRTLQFHYDWITLPFLVMGVWAALEGVSARIAGRRAAWTMLFVLTLSGRWPGWDISRHWPSPGLGDGLTGAFADRAYLRELRIEEPPGHAAGPAPGARIYANGHILAQLTLQPDYRLWLAEPLDLARLNPGDVVIIDGREVGDSALAAALHSPGYSPRGQSPSGRFSVYERGN